MRKFKIGALFLSSFFAVTCSNDQMLRTKANELAQKFIITDGHIDTPWKLSKNYEVYQYYEKTMLYLVRFVSEKILLISNNEE